MIIGIDIGGTKTHIAVFKNDGSIQVESRFKTPALYADFLIELEKQVANFNIVDSPEAVSIAVPGAIQRDTGTIIALGNLTWENSPITKDVAEILHTTKVYVENDANLAALAEARAMPQCAPLVLYITLSTGVGSGIIINNQLIPELAGSEAGQMMVRDENGELHRWETFASGRALVRTTGKEAASLDDAASWKEYAEKVCMGLQPAISVLRPQAVVVGGGVGAHLERFQQELEKQLAALNHSRVYTNPVVVKAHYGENSVVYGCYHHAKDSLA